jgi:hypothetical protein
MAVPNQQSANDKILHIGFIDFNVIGVLRKRRRAKE